MNVISVIFIAITTIATVVIAHVTHSNHQLNKSLSSKSEKHEQEMRDYLLASVLAQLLRPNVNETPRDAINRFNKCYNGETPIPLDY